MIYNPPQGSIEDADARYVQKSGDTMTGKLSFGTGHTTNPSDLNKGVILYDGTHKMGVAASGEADSDMGMNISTGRMNLVTGHQDNNIYMRTAGIDRAFASKRGLEIPTGHSLYIEGQSIEDRYIKTTGGKVTGELEVEGSLHIHGDGDVDTPKLIIKDQDSDERYLLRTEYVPPVGSVSSATVGDVKSAFLTADHGGWVLLDGRDVTTLPEMQFMAATIELGFTTNLPDAFQCVAIQNGKTPLGTIDGSMQRIITAGQMPRHFHPVPAITNDQGVHGFGDMVNPDSGRAYPLTIMRGSAEIININNQNPDSGHMPNYGRMMEDAGNYEPLDITPKSLAVNYFVYLGA